MPRSTKLKMYEDGRCSYCKPTAGGIHCGNQHEGYGCTRPHGHKGDHIACGPASDNPSWHRLRRWSQHKGAANAN